MIHDALSLACQSFPAWDKNQVCIQHVLLLQTNISSYHCAGSGLHRLNHLLSPFPREKNHMTAGLPLLCLHTHSIQKYSFGQENMIKHKYFVFLVACLYRWQAYSSLYSSLRPGDHGYSSIPPQKEIKYSHFENCTTNAFPKTSVITLPLSYLAIHSPFLVFLFGLFQHLQNYSFSICCLRRSEMFKFTSDWASSEETVPEVPQITRKKHCSSQEQCGSYANSTERNRMLPEIYFCLNKLSCFWLLYLLCP